VYSNYCRYMVGKMMRAALAVNRQRAENAKGAEGD
jgi:hypothetical protein